MSGPWIFDGRLADLLADTNGAIRRPTAQLAMPSEWMHNRIIIDPRDDAVRTTVTVDDGDYEAALAVADPVMDKADLFREAIWIAGWPSLPNALARPTRPRILRRARMSNVTPRHGPCLPHIS